MSDITLTDAMNTGALALEQAGYEEGSYAQRSAKILRDAAIKGISVNVSVGDTEYFIALLEADLADIATQSTQARSAGRVGDVMHLQLAEQAAFNLLERMEKWRKTMAERIAANPDPATIAALDGT